MVASSCRNDYYYNRVFIAISFPDPTLHMYYNNWLVQGHNSAANVCFKNAF